MPNSVAPPRSTILIPVPEAAALAREYRQRYDPSAAHGMPEHVTLLYPFLPPADLDTAVSDQLVDICAAATPFTFTLTETRWFGTEVLYLAPEPPDPFIHLTQALIDAFGLPPYEGRHEGINPHLTLGQSADRAGLEGVAAEIVPHLPILAEARQVWLMTREGEEDWVLRDRYPLGLLPEDRV